MAGNAVPINITIPSDLNDELINMANRKGRSRKDLIIKALELFIALDEERSAFMREQNLTRVKTRIFFEAEEDKSPAAVLIY